MKYLLSIIIGSICLVGCNLNSDSPLTDLEVVQTVKCTNLNGATPCSRNTPYAWGQLDSEFEKCLGIYCFANGSPAPQNPGLTKWREGELIPVYFLDRTDSRFTYAMNKAEQIVGYELFDRKGVIRLDISNPHDIDYSDMPTDWGFIWSQGTSPLSCSSGTVSQGPGTTSVVGHAVGFDLGINQPIGSPFAWIHLDSANPDPSCTTIASNEVSLHELAHALGMNNHFDGFGNGDAFNKNAERVLRTMYSTHNPPGQPYDALYVEN